MASANSHSLAKPWQSKNEYLSFVFEIRRPLLKTTRLPPLTVKTVDVPLYAKAILKVSDTDTKQPQSLKGAFSRTL